MKSKKSKNDKVVIISVGGSLIVPEEIDLLWLKDFKALVEEYVSKGFKFVLIAGGGKTARRYQAVAKELAELQAVDLDWMGIGATKLNALLLKTVFKGKVYPDVIDNPTKKISFKQKILVAAGWKPGCSTDFDAVLLAKNLKIKKLVNLSNIDYIYDKDPKKFTDAKKIESISWKDFRKIVGDKWNPGLNAPFDPIASKLSEKLKMEVAIVNGKNIQNLRDYFDGKVFVGSVIK